MRAVCESTNQPQNPSDPIPHAPDSPRVAAEIVAGEGLSFSQAAKIIPPGRSGKPTAPSTLWRWGRSGVRAPDGRIIHLELARVGCRWLTSRPALLRFLAALSRTDGAPPAEAPRQGSGRSAHRQAQVDRAQAELDLLGLC
jgi:hypothetical protein